MKSIVALLLLVVSMLDSIPTFKAVSIRDSDVMGSIDDGAPEVFPGCSWYCGGFVSRESASSNLPAFDTITYIASKAHDFKINTAWIEGKPDYGVGESLEYVFDMTTVKEPHHLGITHIILANGYKKTRKTWEENSRVKTLKMYVDNEAYGLIELLDSYEFQKIAIGKIILPQQKILKMRFEIVDVYKGQKYKDTAITELLFDGVGVH